MEFQKNVAGLRGLAILAVLLYHFFPMIIPQGYLGVDVFYVISGYLITQIIINSITSQQFSIFRFYLARAKRLLPSLIILILVLLLFGWFCLIGSDYQALAKQSIYSLTFISNITFYNDINYFDSMAIEKWLLHTWSLSLEWQFYLAYPIVLMGMHKFMYPKTVKLFLASAFFLGFYIWLYSYIYNTNYAFYLLPSRMWEMMLGAMVFCFPFKRFQQYKLLEIIFFVLLIYCFVVPIEKPINFLLINFICVFFTFFILQCNQHQSALFTNKPFQLLGRWSYSIYLWHWPIRVLLDYYHLPQSWCYLGVFLSIVLGALNFYVIESLYFTDKSDRNRFGVLWRVFACLFIGVLSVSAYISNSDGVLNRYRVLPFEEKLVFPSSKEGYCFYTASNHLSLQDLITRQQKKSLQAGVSCFLGDESAIPKAILFGDSYAAHYEPFLDYIFKKNRMAFHSISASYCSPHFNEQFRGKSMIDKLQCFYNRTHVKENMENYKYIFIAGSWGTIEQQESLVPTLNLIKVAAAKGMIVIILPAPKYFVRNQTQQFLRQAYRQHQYASDEVKATDNATLAANVRLAEFSKKYSNVYMLTREDLFRSTNTFVYAGYEIPDERERGHLSLLASIEAAKRFMKTPRYRTLENILKQ